ncbi:ParB family protein [Acerihabitans arboris]|uniref:ParB/Sulfiredoxin domain-containing protein n=1 Tax=Acerihabitans arboris TaxID=2691583 RepID=A0A845SGT7_9GAMM|nr:ParB family protein [Acerihabitans arboris]NDL64303.1 hypothetical protein [Acerihabitans arboris]
MNMKKAPDLSEALLMRGKKPMQSADPSGLAVLPLSEIAMVLTLDQLRPNPDNPRTSRNSRYEDIKASIRTRGLDSIPKVTRDPDGDDVYIFSDGGNTRYQILCELWQETGENRFYRVHTIFKPWPGRLQCVIGHLAENEVRGDLAYIEKALGIHKARGIWEEQLNRSVSLREFSELLNNKGYPIHASSISRMEDTLKFLYPYLPDLLQSGLSRAQVMPLLALRSAAEKTWSQHYIAVESSMTFDEVFKAACLTFNSPDVYSLEMFRDELIGALLNALPHPSLNYDRWLIELDPKEQQRRELYGEPLPPPPMPAPATEAPPVVPPGPVPTHIPPHRDGTVPVTGLRAGALTGQSMKPEPACDTPSTSHVPSMPSGIGRPSLSDGDDSRIYPRTESQPDLYGGPAVLSGEIGSTENLSGMNLFSALGESADEDPVRVSSVAFAATGLEPVNDIWHIPALQDDIEHLQDMAYRLAFELAEAMGDKNGICEDKHPGAAGYAASSGSIDAFVLFLNGMAGHVSNTPFNMFAFCLNFFGSAAKNDTPVLADVHVVKMMRLFRVLRRLRELQREGAKGGPNDEDI